MSNLLNKKNNNKLKERGPAITPTAPFHLEKDKPSQAQKPEKKSELTKAMELERKVASVRVKKSTRDKLNALVNLNKADTIDELIEIMIDEYVTTHVLKEEKKQYDLIVSLYKQKN